MDNITLPQYTIQKLEPTVVRPFIMTTKHAIFDSIISHDSKAMTAKKGSQKKVQLTWMSLNTSEGSVLQMKYSTF